MVIVVEYFGFLKEFIYILMYVAAIESQPWWLCGKIVFESTLHHVKTQAFVYFQPIL